MIAKLNDKVIAVLAGSTTVGGLLAMCAVTGEWFGLVGIPAAVIAFTVTAGRDNGAASEFSNAWFAALFWAYVTMMGAGALRAAIG